MGFVIPAIATAALNAGAISVGTATAISAAAPIVGAVGMGLSAISSITSGNQAAASSQYNATVQRNNAEINRRNAEMASREGNANVEKEQLKNRATMGAIKTSQAASGVDITSPSAVDVQSSARELGQLNAITLRSQAVRKAYGYEVAATSDEAQAGLDESNAKHSKTAGYVNAAGTLLGAGSAGQKSGMWDQFLSSTGM